MAYVFEKYGLGGSGGGGGVYKRTTVNTPNELYENFINVNNRIPCHLIITATTVQNGISIESQYVFQRLTLKVKDETYKILEASFCSYSDDSKEIKGNSIMVGNIGAGVVTNIELGAHYSLNVDVGGADISVSLQGDDQFSSMGAKVEVVYLDVLT